jgi:hypothetical protein
MGSVLQLSDKSNTKSLGAKRKSESDKAYLLSLASKNIHPCCVM